MSNALPLSGGTVCSHLLSAKRGQEQISLLCPILLDLVSLKIIFYAYLHTMWRTESHIIVILLHWSKEKMITTLFTRLLK